MSTAKVANATFDIGPADLALTQSANPNPAVVGQDVTFTLTVTNNGPNSAGGGVVNVTLPTGATFISASPACVPGGPGLICNLTPIASGANTQLTVVVRPTAVGTITNSATASAVPPDPNSANNTSSLGVPVNSAARLGNISTRMQVGTGSDVLIGGFIIGGASSKRVAIVATGPSLTQYGINNALANPTLTLVRQSDQVVIASNDDWQTAGNAAQLQAKGFAPPNPLESGILITLPPGAYTAILSGAGGGTGVGIIGVYDAGP
jgi:uncharacterized repeat protein (TIGR01451 family)